MKKLGKWLLYALSGLVALLLCVLIVGLFVSPEIEAAATIEIKAPPAKVWDLIGNLENLPKWSSEIASVKMLSENPKIYRAEGPAGSADYEVIASEPPHRILTRMTASSFNVTGNYDLRVDPSGDGSRVRVGMKMHLGNPLFRTLSLFMDADAEEHKVLEELRSYVEASQ